MVRRRRVSGGLYIFLLSLICSSHSYAPAQTPSWFEQNKKSDPKRFEGLLDQPNARREYDVLNFLEFPGTPPDKIFSGTPARLHIHFCQPQAPASNTAGIDGFIEVRQLTGHVNYLMKAAPKAPPSPAAHQWVAFAWPTDAVVSRNAIDPNKLGVVIHLGEDNEFSNRLAPAFFSISDDAPSADIRNYILVLRIQQNTLDTLSYVVGRGKNALLTCHYQNDLHPCLTAKPASNAPVEAGSLVKLPFELSQVAPGPVTVHIEGRYHDSDETLTANFSFDHEPRCQ